MAKPINPNLRVCGVCGHHVGVADMVIDPTKPAACKYCHEMVLTQAWPEGPRDTLGIAKAIRGFRRHEEDIKQDHYETVECWEPLGYAIIDHWYATLRSLQRTRAHDELGWDLATRLSEEAELHQFPLPTNVCVGLAYLFMARIEKFVEDNPLVPIDASKEPS